MMEEDRNSFAEELRRDGIFLRDERMLHLYQQVKTVSRTDANVLIHGESGTGKDLFAKYIHKNSGRKGKAFVHLNCSAIPQELFEAELFGYEAGAFSGALASGKVGLVELADGGTLYLDEVGEITPQNQATLLYLLEYQQLTRVGGSQTRQVDLRIISATNRDLAACVQEGLFRSDLYYRLKTVEVHIPPLRERPKDILTFVECFEASRGNLHSFEQDALDYLLSLPWNGNVRELQNFLEKLSVLEEPGPIKREMLTDGRYRFSQLKEVSHQKRPEVRFKTLKQATAEFERAYITQAIHETATLSEAAQRLGLDLTTLNRKKRKLGIYKRAGGARKKDGI